MRLSGWAIIQPDAMLFTAPAQSLAFELGRVVQIKQPGFATHRPVHLHPQPFQPGAFVADDMRQAQTN
ncbi:hypothetical protein D3C73_1350110 [compost metagenome]